MREVLFILDNTENLSYNPEAWTRVFHASWYKHQMTGWSKSSYWLLGIGLVILLITGFMGGFSWLALTSTLAGMIGFTCTISITNGKAINGITGFVSALLLIGVALHTKNFSDIIMQGAYIVLLDIPVLLNKEWGTDFEPRKMNKKYALQTLAWFIGFFIATYALDTFLGSPRVLIDAFSATIGLTGAILTVRRFSFAYILWTLQGITSVALWFVTALQGHAVWVLMLTYILYLANDMVAFFDSKWFKIRK